MLKLNWENGRGYLEQSDNLTLYVDGKLVFQGKPDWKEIFAKYGELYISSDEDTADGKTILRLLTWD